MATTLRTTKLRAILAIGSAVAALNAFPQAAATAAVRAVPTYEAVGLYWSAPGGAGNAGCDVRYRKTGDTAWTSALAMWFDAAANECRGSIVNLVPGTAYDAQLGVNGNFTQSISFATWANAKPVSSTVTVNGGSGTLNISTGGNANGYVVYDGKGAVLDGQNAAQYNVTINASYVIVRNLVLKGAKQDAIRISPNATDVIIEDNDISGWGRTRDGTWGTDMDSGIRAVCTSETLTRVTVQRNRIHDPRYPANSWSDGHPAGPQGITFSYCGGNNVFRWNEIYSAQNHFNDGMGGEDNFSTTGFPNRDSDVYGNRIEMTWDDGLEIEGGNTNVRVWGNYLNNTATGIATTVTSVGPVYIFRNVYNRSRFYEKAGPDADDRQPMFKSGSSASFGNGRRYLFHNTMLQATQSGLQYPLGGGAGVGGTGDTQLVQNTISMNNIYHIWKPNSSVYQIGTTNTFQNDMFNGRMDTAVVGGIKATPAYAAGNGWQSESGGMYQLAAGTPGYDGGVRIANFNDGYLGNAPDVGAAEGGAAPMKFGIAAATSTTSTGTPGTPAAPVAPTTPTPSGSLTPSSGMDSSSYTVAAGQSVTFTASVYGNGSTPSGTVQFTADSVAIAGCAGVALSAGKAACTTAGLTAGTHAIRGVYSGDSTYSGGQAGPITQTVTAAASGAASIDVAISQSANPASATVGKDVVFNVSVVNNGASTTPVSVKDTLPSNASFVWASSGCSATGVTVTCSIASLAPGQRVALQVVVRPSAAVSMTNTAVATATGDANTADNVATANVAVTAAPTAKMVVRYRLYSPVTNEHHFTTNPLEYATLGSYTGAWVQEGPTGKVLDNPGAYNGVNAVPYYRLYNSNLRWHHWTTDPNEYYTVATYPGWNAEGIDGYVLPTATAGTTELFRLVYANSSLHHWTTDPNEYKALIALYGWIGEGGSTFLIQ